MKFVSSSHSEVYSCLHKRFFQTFIERLMRRLIVGFIANIFIVGFIANIFIVGFIERFHVLFIKNIRLSALKSEV